MSRSIPGWFFIDHHKLPMLLVYEISIGQCGSVGIKIVARFMNIRNHQRTLAELGESGRKQLANLVIFRRRYTVKRLGNSRDNYNGNIFERIMKLRKNNTSPQSLNNVGGTSPSLVVVPVALSVATPGTVPISGLDQTIKEDTNGSSMPVNGLTSPAAILPDQSPCYDSNTPSRQLELSNDANAVQTCAWLRASRFQAFESTFSSFSAADILRLSRDDLIQICGLADGIRLFNALHSKAPTPKLTLYFAIEGNANSLWRAVYLENLTSSTLASRLLATFNLPNDRLHSVLLQGPQGIHVLVSNELVANMKDESMYLVETIRDSPSDRYKLLLKPSSR